MHVDIFMAAGIIGLSLRIDVYWPFDVDRKKFHKSGQLYSARVQGDRQRKKQEL
jgi:hypothetical protein